MHLRDMASDLRSGLIMGFFLRDCEEAAAGKNRFLVMTWYVQGDGKLIQAANRPFGPP